MSGFIPDHILVYIATDSKVRGKGIGSLLMDQLKKECSGAIALHVEESNPAQFLYEKKGFEKKYIEMRLNR
jgi:ribosomal protein S18 acetylase RimI-like enzyme